MSVASIEISSLFLLGWKVSVDGAYCLYHRVWILEMSIVLEMSCQRKSNFLCYDLHMDNFNSYIDS